jgi:hypothetical protein
MNYRTMYMQAIKGDGAFGKWRHLGLSTPTDFDIVTPNNDTPYSYAWLDLRAEPWVLTIPKIEPKRFYTRPIFATCSASVRASDAADRRAEIRASGKRIVCSSKSARPSVRLRSQRNSAQPQPREEALPRSR